MEEMHNKEVTIVKLYHMTYANRLPSILEKGLRPNEIDNFDYSDTSNENLKHQKGVYLSDDLSAITRMFNKSEATLVKASKEDVKQGRIVLEVEVDSADLRPDLNNENSYLVDEVKPENITVTDIRQYNYLTKYRYHELDDEGYEDLMNHLIDYYINRIRPEDVSLVEFVELTYGSMSDDFRAVAESKDITLSDVDFENLTPGLEM